MLISFSGSCWLYNTQWYDFCCQMMVYIEMICEADFNCLHICIFFIDINKQYNCIIAQSYIKFI